MINRVILTGRLTKDPDLRYTPNGVPVATFTLAVNRTFANAQGEKETDFVNCVIWRKQAENVANYLKKGSLAGVDGRIQTRNYEGQDGKRVYVTEVLAESVQFLEPKNKSNGDGNYSSYQQQRTSTPNQPNNQGQGNSNGYGNGNGSYNQPNKGYTPQNQTSSTPPAGNGGYHIDDDPFASSGKINIADDDLPF